MDKKLLFYDFYIGTLEFDTPFHIGCSDIATETDSPLLKDAQGKHYLPGSSVIGAMKARTSALFPGELNLIKVMFGWQEKESGAMSRIMIEDAYPEATAATFRDGVAIDRTLGSASHGAKYDLEITQRGIRYPFVMRLELREGDNSDEMRKIIAAVLKEFGDGKIKLGGGKSRGLGRCKLTERKVKSLDFSKNGEVAKYLLKRDPMALLDLELPSADAGITPEALDITIEASVDGPFLVKHGRDDEEHDAVFTRVKDGNGSEIEYIPGSSIKGPLRARAEKIIRTLGGKACTAVGQESCAEIIRQKVEKKEFTVNDAEKIKENSCVICRLFGNGYLASRIEFDDAFFKGIEVPRKKVFDHVAIDRFTGGAAEGKLFDTEPIVSATTDLHIVVKNPTPFDRALLAFLLRDLRDGFPPLRFGYGKQKGHGLLKCDTKTCVNSEELNDGGFIHLLGDSSQLEDWWKETKDGQ